MDPHVVVFNIISVLVNRVLHQHLFSQPFCRVLCGIFKNKISAQSVIVGVERSSCSQLFAALCSLGGISPHGLCAVSASFNFGPFATHSVVPFQNNIIRAVGHRRCWACALRCNSVFLSVALFFFHICSIGLVLNQHLLFVRVISIDHGLAASFRIFFLLDFFFFLIPMDVLVAGSLFRLLHLSLPLLLALHSSVGLCSLLLV